MSDSLQPHGLYSPWDSPGQNTGVGSLSLLPGIFPTQGSNPGLPHCRWILHQLSHKGSPRILEWVAYPFSSCPRTKPGSPSLQVDSLPTELSETPHTHNSSFHQVPPGTLCPPLVPSSPEMPTAPHMMLVSGCFSSPHLPSYPGSHLCKRSLK